MAARLANDPPGALTFRERGCQIKAAPSMIQVPGDKSELAGGGMQIDVKILAIGKEAIVTGEQHQAGQKPRELIQVQIALELPREFPIVGV